MAPCVLDISAVRDFRRNDCAYERKRAQKVASRSRRGASARAKGLHGSPQRPGQGKHRALWQAHVLEEWHNRDGNGELPEQGTTELLRQHASACFDHLEGSGAQGFLSSGADMESTPVIAGAVANAAVNTPGAKAEIAAEITKEAMEVPVNFLSGDELSLSATDVNDLRHALEQLRPPAEGTIWALFGPEGQRLEADAELCSRVAAAAQLLDVSGTWKMVDNKRKAEFCYVWSQCPGAEEFTGFQEGYGAICEAKVQGHAIEWTVKKTERFDAVTCAGTLGSDRRTIIDGKYWVTPTGEELGHFHGFWLRDDCSP